MRKLDPPTHPKEGDRLFIGVYPGGFVYSDRHNEAGGDYLQLAFLCYETLTLTLNPNVALPESLLQRIVDHSARYQAQPGGRIQIDGSGHTAVLGGRLASHQH